MFSIHEQKAEGDSHQDLDTYDVPFSYILFAQACVFDLGCERSGVPYEVGELCAKFLNMTRRSTKTPHRHTQAPHKQALQMYRCTIVCLCLPLAGCDH